MVIDRIALAEPGPFRPLHRMFKTPETWKLPTCLLVAPSGALIFCLNCFGRLGPAPGGESSRKWNE